MSNVYYIREGIFTVEQIQNEKSPLKAIRNFCRYHCCCGDMISWKECPNQDCFLHKFRLGKSGRTREMTDEQRKLFAEKMRNSRDNTNSQD